ncbi:MAG TPA: hypothetical protein VMU34_05765 [Mycobacterium sp.]|nr:hypothetical protein [Mycobacterium sp.]
MVQVASTGAATEAQKKRKRRRQAAVTGSAVAAGAVVATQAHPASRTHTAIQRRKLVKRHVARAQADHDRLASLRAKVFPRDDNVRGSEVDQLTSRAIGLCDPT